MSELEQQTQDQAAGEEVSLLESIMARTSMEPSDEGFDVAKKGVEFFVSEMLKGKPNEDPINKALVDRMIAQVDQQIGKQLDVILHHPDFQEIESLSLIHI